MQAGPAPEADGESPSAGDQLGKGRLRGGHRRAPSICAHASYQSA
jgi:hypothetical protein